MIAVCSTLIVFAVSLVVIRIATVGLTMTGISRDLAQFQALSAFTGSGFTTKESEDIVNHPLRRRIVMHLMLLGHVGVVVAIPSVILSFINTDSSSDWHVQVTLRMSVLLAGSAILLLLARSRVIERLMWSLNKWALGRWSGLYIHDYVRLLRVAHDYVISELHVHADDWLAGHTLEQLRLASEGVLVLGIEKPDGTYQGTPRGYTRLEGGDCLIVYGQQQSLLDLDERRAGIEGNVQHVMAVTRQMDMMEAERSKEPPTGDEAS